MFSNFWLDCRYFSFTLHTVETCPSQLCRKSQPGECTLNDKWHWQTKGLDHSRAPQGLTEQSRASSFPQRKRCRCLSLSLLQDPKSSKFHCANWQVGMTLGRMTCKGVVADWHLNPDIQWHSHIPKIPNIIAESCPRCSIGSSRSHNHETMPADALWTRNIRKSFRANIACNLPKVKCSQTESKKENA